MDNETRRKYLRQEFFKWCKKHRITGWCVFVETETDLKRLKQKPAEGIPLLGLNYGTAMHCEPMGNDAGYYVIRLIAETLTRHGTEFSKQLSRSPDPGLAVLGYAKEPERDSSNSGSNPKDGGTHGNL